MNTELKSGSEKACLRGLYAITPADLCTRPGALLDAVDAALAGGAALIQYRDKQPDHAHRLELAAALLGRCQARGVPLIVNDDVELAAAIGSCGVHLGEEDMPLAEARERLGPKAIIGVTCADSLQRGRAAVAGGADYLAFGAFFPSRTKQATKQATLSLLRAAVSEFPVPICAIGGLTPANARPLIEAGADLIAAVEGVFGAADIEAAVKAYTVLYAGSA